MKWIKNCQIKIDLLYESSKHIIVMKCKGYGDIQKHKDFPAEKNIKTYQA